MLIGIHGKKRHGKSTLANQLIEKHNFIEVRWAHPLKEIIAKQLMGLSNEQVYGKLKETNDPYWGMSPRKILQLVGTECFRKQIHDDFWVKIGERTIKDLFYKDDEARVVVSDCRFQNEIKSIKRLGGITVRVVRESYHTSDYHASEIALDDWTDWDYQILAATGDIDGLKGRIDQIVLHEETHVRTNRKR